MEGNSYRGDGRDTPNIVFLNRAIDYFNQEYAQNIETNKINPLDFKQIYSDKEINDDLCFVKERETNWEKKEIGDFQSKLNKRISDAFEKALSLRGEQNNWLGENFFMTNASSYDDYKHGADIFGFFKLETNVDNAEEGIEFVTFDVTSAVGYDLEKKLLRNIEKLTGKLPCPEIKYFSHENVDFKGKLKNVIPLVIGLDAVNTKILLGELYKADLNNKRREMAGHPCSILLLKEIKTQLDGYVAILTNRHDPNNYLSKINTLILTIDEIIDEKQDLAENKKTVNLLKTDGVLNGMKNFFTEYIKNTKNLDKTQRKW